MQEITTVFTHIVILVWVFISVLSLYIYDLGFRSMKNGTFWTMVRRSVTHWFIRMECFIWFFYIILYLRGIL